MNTGPGPAIDTPQHAEETPLGPRKNRTAPAKARKVKDDSGRQGAGRNSASSRKSTSWVTELLEWSRTLFIAVIVVLCMNYFVFSLSTVEGRSMEPTLDEKEWLFINKISYLLGKPKIGDVVILLEPGQDEEHKTHLVKRIIAGPGDRVEIRQGELYRNGQLVLEPYTDVLIEDADFGPVTVEGDHYFVMGDNRHFQASRDSRSFQAVERSALLGRAEFILWPITRWARL